MKKSVKSNMYAVSLDTTRELFQAYLSGNEQALVCVVSEKALTSKAVHALQSSFERLGYGKTACTFVVSSVSCDSTEAPPLSEKELFMLVEGLDPVAVVLADKHSALLCERAYRASFVLNETTRTFGRDLAVFNSFEAMLEDASLKQKAWGLLKRLPAFSS